MRTKSASVSDSSSTRMGKSPLQLGDEILGLGHVEGARGDEEHVVGLERTVLGRHRRALHDGQKIALHALARNVGAVAAGLAAGHLVELVDEDDAILLGPANRLLGDAIHVDELADFLLGERLQGLGNAEAAVLGAVVLGKHVLQVEHHVFHAGAGEDIGERLSALAGVDLDHLVVELALAQQAAQILARGRLGRRGLGRGDGAGKGIAPDVVRGGRAGGKRTSSKRSSACSRARGLARSRSSSRSMDTAVSARSRTMESTSRPT
jgi:hypothetical protein